MKKDVDGKKLAKGNVVENWQGRRAILNEDLEAIDIDGELKTPIKFIGVKADNLSLEKHTKPSWHARNRR